MFFLALVIFIVFCVLPAILVFKSYKLSVLRFVLTFVAFTILAAGILAAIVALILFKSTNPFFIYSNIGLILIFGVYGVVILVLSLNHFSVLTFALTFAAFNTLAVISAFKFLANKSYQWIFLTSLTFSSLVAPLAFSVNKWVFNRVNFIKDNKARLLSKIFYISLLLWSLSTFLDYNVGFVLFPLPASALEFLRNQFRMNFTSDNYVQFELTNIPVIEDFTLVVYWISILSIGTLLAFFQIWFYLLMLSLIFTVNNITARYVFGFLLALALVFFHRISFSSVFTLFLILFIVLNIYSNQRHKNSLKKQ